MALIKCPECGQEVSDIAKSCPHCGCPIVQKKIKKFSKKSIMVLLIIFLLLIITVGVITLIKNNKTLGEKAVENSLQELDKILLAPDTINIYECVSRDFTKDEDANTGNEPYKEVMVYIHFSASNQDGGITESEYIFACNKKGEVIEYIDMDKIQSSITEGKMSELIMDYDNYVFYASLNGWDDDYVIYTKDEIKKLMK